MQCADYCDPETQNAFFKGYTQQVEVTNLLVFNVFGEVIFEAVNFPGSFHDSRLAYTSGLVTKKLSDALNPPGYSTLCDGAFLASRKAGRGKIVRARKSEKYPESYKMIWLLQSTF